MNIEELVEKHAKECAYSVHDKIGLYPQDQMWVFNSAKSSIRNALTEQAEAFKGELSAYDGMVRELTKTVEDMRDSLASAERERDELRKAWQIAFQHIDKDTHGNDHAMVYAAIAQGKGE